MVDKETLRKAQLKMLDILIVIDSICKKNQISYWLDSGTLLGAVRHQGFIPWDDDIDIGMLREDYYKFIEACKTDLPTEYFLQSAKTDPYYFNLAIPLKIRMNNTLVIETGAEKTGLFNEKSHNGLYVDVFPFDNYDQSKIKRGLIGNLFSKVAYHKKLSKHAYVGKIKMSKKAFIFNRFVNIFFPLSIIEKIEQKLIKRSRKLKKDNVSYGIDLFFEKTNFKYSDIFPLREIVFENTIFKAPNKTPKYLEKLYESNYMQLPPEESRVWHFEKLELYD